jgi:hypothetical protein
MFIYVYQNVTWCMEASRSWAINLLPSDFLYLFCNLYHSLVMWDLMLALKDVFTIHLNKVRRNINKQMVNPSCKTEASTRGHWQQVKKVYTWLWINCREGDRISNTQNTNMDLLQLFLYIKPSAKPGLDEHVITMNYEYALPHRTLNIQHTTKL